MSPSYSSFFHYTVVGSFPNSNNIMLTINIKWHKTSSTQTKTKTNTVKTGQTPHKTNQLKRGKMDIHSTLSHTYK